jgi:hypothetical protein
MMMMKAGAGGSREVQKKKNGPLEHVRWIDTAG